MSNPTGCVAERASNEGFSYAGRADHEDVVMPCRRDHQRPLGRLLAPHVGEVAVVPARGAEDLVEVFTRHGLRLVSLIHVGGDGRLKNLDVVPLDPRHLHGKPELRCEPIHGRLLGLDATTGEERWMVRAERGFDAEPLVLGERVVAPSFDGVVRVLAAVACRAEGGPA